MERRQVKNTDGHLLREEGAGWGLGLEGREL